MSTKLGDFTDANWQDKQVNRVKNWTVGKIVAITLSVVVALSLLGVGLGIAGGWFDEARRQVGVENVKSQWQFAYDYKTSMEAIGQQWCSVRGVELSTTDPATKDQRVSQRLAIETNYARVAGQYNAGVENAFKAKYIKPGDVPQFAPTLADQIAASCPTLGQ